MPLYTYRCPNGHENDKRADLSLEYINCPDCEAAARRVPFYREGYIMGETVAKGYSCASKDGDIKNRYGQYRTKLWDENAREVAYQKEREERRSGPDPFDMALRRAATENKQVG